MKQKQYQQPRRSRHRRPHRKRFNSLAGFLLSIIVIAVVVFGASLFFKVHFVEVTGVSKCLPQDVRAASNISDGDFLFYVNKRSAASSIIANQPYVDTVKIKSVLPNIVLIDVTECVPLAYIAQEGAYWFLDKRGKLLEEVLDKPDLPEITGLTLLYPLIGTTWAVSDEDEYKKTSLLELIALLNEKEIKPESICFDSATGLRFEYLNRFDVIVGMPESFERKISYLEPYIAQLENNATGTIYLPDEIGGKGRFIPG